MLRASLISLFVVGCTAEAPSGTVVADAAHPTDGAAIDARPLPDADALDTGARDAALPPNDMAPPIDAAPDVTRPADAALVDAAPLEPPACAVIGAHPTRRLTPVQYRASVAAFGLPTPPLDLTGDVAPIISQLATEKLLDAAHTLAMVADLTPAGLLPCDPAADPVACAAQTQAEWADQLFRRPPTAAELDWLAAVWAETAGDFADRARLLLEVLLAAPQFVYRIEAADGGALPATARAARLAYTLTDAPPDAALRAVDLADPAARAAQAERLATSVAGRAKLRRFIVAWAGLDRIGHKVEPFDRAAALAESARFIDRIIADDGRFADLLQSTAAHLDAESAPLYGVAADAGRLPADERAGLLTRIAFLAAHAGPVAKSPIQRGVFVREQLLCSPLPPPPPNVDDSPVVRGSSSDDGQPRSIRALTDRRTSAPLCNGCHQFINPAGFLFGHYDARGRFVRVEAGVDGDGIPYEVPVDARATLADTDLPAPLADAIALSAALADDPMALDCFAARWLAFAWDRPLTAADACDLERLQAAFRAADGRLSALVVATAQLTGMAR